jgi:hypothetical protein
MRKRIMIFARVRTNTISKELYPEVSRIRTVDILFLSFLTTS